MFALIPATIVLVAAGFVSGLVVPRTAPPPGWLTNVLERYDDYHTRYLALGCENKHNTIFFDDCCHPMLATETLAKNRKPYCNPRAASTTATSAHPTTSVTDDGDDDDCDDSDDGGEENGKTSASATHASSTHAATTTSHTTSTHKATSTTHSSAAPSKSASTGSDGQVFTGGIATYFFQKGNPGACGQYHSDNDLVAAIDEARYGDSGKKSSLCGKKVQITNTKNGKTVIVAIVDDCPTCVNKNSIDLSVAAFKAIAPMSQGTADIAWHFL